MIKASEYLNEVDRYIAPSAAPMGEPLAVWPIGVTAATAAALFQMSELAWWRAHSAGKVPLPIRPAGGRSCRWCEAGCPPRDHWKEIKEAL